MLFPFTPPRAATFHMGSVDFPIDVIFVDAQGVVRKIVAGARPGTRERWSQPVVGAVVELAGGSCARAGLELGNRIRVASQVCNMGRMLTEADGPALVDGFYGKEPSPGVDQWPTTKTNPKDRRKDRAPPDEAFEWTTEGMGLGQWDMSSGPGVPPEAEGIGEDYDPYEERSTRAGAWYGSFR